MEFAFVESLDTNSRDRLDIYDEAWLRALNDHYILGKRTVKPRKAYKTKEKLGDAMTGKRTMGIGGHGTPPSDKGK